MQHYQAAVLLVQQGKYEKALAAFEKLLAAAPAELKERCKMYISTCQRQMDKHNLTFLTPEEHYDYAVSQLNTGYYEEAREQFNLILADYPRADYAFYGLALLDAMTGRTQDCLRNLGTGHRTEQQEPSPGACRQRLPKHGRRPPLYRAAVSRGPLARTAINSNQEIKLSS